MPIGSFAVKPCQLEKLWTEIKWNVFSPFVSGCRLRFKKLSYYYTSLNYDSLLIAPDVNLTSQLSFHLVDLFINITEYHTCCGFILVPFQLNPYSIKGKDLRFLLQKWSCMLAFLLYLLNKEGNLYYFVAKRAWLPISLLTYLFTLPSTLPYFSPSRFSLAIFTP